MALHVLDEAGNGFLATYNPIALAIKHNLPFLPIPLFTYQQWIGRLLIALALWLALTPLAFRGVKLIKGLAVPATILVGIANGLSHIGYSIYVRHFAAGVYSAPLIVFPGVLLLRDAIRQNKELHSAVGLT